MIPTHLFKLAASACSPGIFPGGPGLYDGLCKNGEVQLGSLSGILILLGNVVRILTAFAGVLAVLMIIIGGVWYVVSMGNPDRIKRAREIITQAVTGLVVIMLAYAILTYVVNVFS